MPGRVESAFRGFGTQCWVFDGWAAQGARRVLRGDDAERPARATASTSSGPTVDMFTADWASSGRRSSATASAARRRASGSTTTRGATASSLPYPIDPDDRKDGSRCATRWRPRGARSIRRPATSTSPGTLRFVGRGRRGAVPRRVARERTGDARRDHARAVAARAARAGRATPSCRCATGASAARARRWPPTATRRPAGMRRCGSTRAGGSRRPRAAAPARRERGAGEGRRRRARA